jgi:hypothetical protein
LRRLAICLVVLVGCARAAPRPTLVLPDPEAGPSAPIDRGALEGWSGGEVTSSAPVRFAPEPGGPALQAVILARHIADLHELLLVIATLDGVIVADASLARIRGGVRREVLSDLSRWPLGAGRAGLRADVSVYELRSPRRFAVKALVLEVAAGRPRVLLERIVESGDDVRNRRATLAAREVDGDGAAEIVVDERETGARRRTVVYRRDDEGVYRTRDRSLFDD